MFLEFRAKQSNNRMSTNANGATGGPAPKIAFVEFHDATMTALTVQREGVAVFNFDHIAVYIEESPNRFNVWSYRADLLFQGVEQLSVEKRLGNSDYVSDGHVIDAAGQEVELALALDWTHADKVELVFSSAGVLSAKISHVRLNSDCALKKFEEWIGPLRSDVGGEGHKFG